MSSVVAPADMIAWMSDRVQMNSVASPCSVDNETSMNLEFLTFDGASFA
jgi:hypothetical protein